MIMRRCGLNNGDLKNREIHWFKGQWRKLYLSFPALNV